jgi:hypothetical protein
VRDGRFRIRNELAQAIAGDTGLLLVPLRELRSELIAERLELTAPFIDRGEVFVTKGQHLCARFLAGARELKDVSLHLAAWRFVRFEFAGERLIARSAAPRRRNWSTAALRSVR